MTTHHHHLFEFILRTEVVRTLDLCLDIDAPEGQDGSHHTEKNMLHKPNRFYLMGQR